MRHGIRLVCNTGTGSCAGLSWECRSAEGVVGVFWFAKGWMDLRFIPAVWPDLMKKCDFLRPLGETGKGSSDPGGVCRTCGKRFKHSRSIYRHIAAMHPQLIMTGEGTGGGKGLLGSLDNYFGTERTEQPSEPSCCKEFQKRLIELICAMGISLSVVKKKKFLQLIELVGGRKESIPSFPKLRSLITVYAAEIKDRMLREMRGRHVSLIVDGATVNERTFYCVTCFCERRLYFAGIYPVPVADHESLARVLSAPVEEIVAAGAVVTSAVTDNARNLTLSMTPAELPGPGLCTANQRTSVQAITGTRIIHISCGIHTCQLILVDLMKEDIEFAQFKMELQNLMTYLKTRKVKNFLRDNGLTCKIPMIQDIKWLSYFEVFSFIEKNQAKLNQCLKAWRQYSMTAPVVEEIPEKWMEYLKTLEPLAHFVLRAQEDSVYLFEFREEQIKLKDTWVAMGSPLSKHLCKLMKQRFRDTADGTLMKLAHLFSLKAINKFREKFELLYSWRPEDLVSPRRAALNDKREKLTKKFTQLAQYWGVTGAETAMPILFSVFLGNLVRDRLGRTEDVEVFYQNLLDQDYTTEGDKPVNIKWQGFASVAWRIAQLPASEAVAERVFSHLEVMLPARRARAKDDLIAAQMTIRMQQVFDESNKQFDFRKASY